MKNVNRRRNEGSLSNVCGGATHIRVVANILFLQ